MQVARFRAHRSRDYSRERVTAASFAVATRPYRIDGQREIFEKQIPDEGKQRAESSSSRNYRLGFAPRSFQP